MAELVGRCTVAGDGRVGAGTVDGLGGPTGRPHAADRPPRAGRDRLASNPGRARSRSTSFRASSQRLTASGRCGPFWHRSKAGRSDRGAALGRNGRHGRVHACDPGGRRVRCRSSAIRSATDQSDAALIPPRPGCWRQGDGVRAAQRRWPEAADRARRQGGQGPGHQPAVVRRRGGPCPRGRRLAARERAEERPDRARPGSWRPGHSPS